MTRGMATKGERASKMAEMYLECHDVRKVAKQFKCQVATVRRTLRRWGRDNPVRLVLKGEKRPAPKSVKRASPERPVWRTKDGRTIAIADMDDRHLRNPRFFLERAYERLQHDLVTNPPSFSGEMAQYYADQEWEHLVSTSIEEMFPAYEDIVAEMRKRKAASR